MSTRITHPTLAELWRVLLATLEDRGAEGAPALARKLAVSALTGRPAEAKGLRVERRGDALVVTDLGPGNDRPSPSSSSRRAARLNGRRPRRRRSGRPIDGALTPLP
jgi:hypothetical protein